MPLAEARAALASCDWERAWQLAAGATTRSPVEEAERLDALAEACWWLGRMGDCIEARRHAHELFAREGCDRQAAQVAIWLYEHHCFQGRPAMGSGWLHRARRALEGDTGCREWGNLLLREAEVLHGGGRLDEALDRARAALALGRRLRCADLEAEALQATGRLLIDAGRPVEGMAHLDEAMLLAVEGRLGPYATGKVHCSLISACEDVGDLRRAAEWTEASAAWSARHPFAVFPGLCRVKRAEVLQWRGEWEEAEREARRACEELGGVRVSAAAAAWVEVGEIRRRVGDLDGAEEAFAHAEELCCTPTAGLTLLRLAQGRVGAAVDIVDAGLADETWSALARARLLPAKVQVALAAGDLDGAAAATAELRATADAYGTLALRAAADVAGGRVALARGDAAVASRQLRRAVEAWRELEVPYETATAQLLLGQACGLLGDAAGEARWSATAVATFQRLGAAYDARPVGTEAAAGGTGRRELPCGLTEREVEVLRLVATGATNKDVARALSLSQKTVARHLSNIFTKTGVTSRAAATAFAFEHGLAGSRT